MGNYHKNIIFSALLLTTLVPGTVLAFQKSKVDVQVQNDFVVEPGKTEMILDPGESRVKNITITNRINRVVNFKLSTEDLVGSQDARQPVILLGGERGPYSIKDLIIPEITEFSLAFGERIVIPVRVTVPVDVEPRGYYGALIVSNDPTKAGNEDIDAVKGETRIVSRIGSLFLVKVNGVGKEEGSLVDFKTVGPQKAFYEKRPGGFEIAYANTGNVHLVPYGKITITNLMGRTVAELPVDAYFVLPNSTRYQEVRWQEGVSLGRYTAHLSLYKGYGTEYETSKISFWVLPWKILVFGFIIITLLVSLIYYFTTRFELRKK